MKCIYCNGTGKKEEVHFCVACGEEYTEKEVTHTAEGEEA